MKKNKKSNSSVKHLDISGKDIDGILDLSNYPELEYLDCSYNQITEITNIPYTIKYLDCSHNQIKELSYEYTNHQFLDYFNCSKNPVVMIYYPFDIKPKKYPLTLKHIEYSGPFNHPIDNLPEGLETLTFFSCEYLDSEFNQPINNLPNTLKKIHLSNEFNHQIDDLPDSLTELIFEKYSKFNHRIDNLPSNLKVLYLGYHFNQPIDNLPLHLEILCMGYSIFSHSLDNLPDTIYELTLGEKFNLPIEKVPKKIRTIMFAGEDYPYKKQLYKMCEEYDFNLKFDIGLY